jgi:hypothetical protein
VKIGLILRTDVSYLFDFTFYDWNDPETEATEPIKENDPGVLGFNLWPARLVNKPQDSSSQEKAHQLLWSTRDTIQESQLLFIGD